MFIAPGPIPAEPQQHDANSVPRESSKSGGNIKDEAAANCGNVLLDWAAVSRPRSTHTTLPETCARAKKAVKSARTSGFLCPQKAVRPWKSECPPRP